MQVSDALSGLVFCVLGLAIAIANWHMPAPAGLPVSPGMYPAVIGGAMALFGALIAIHGLLRTGLSGLVEIDPWMRRPRAVAAVVAMIAAMVAYVIGAELAGFLVGGGVTGLDRGIRLPGSLGRGPWFSRSAEASSFTFFSPASFGFPSQ